MPQFPRVLVNSRTEEQDLVDAGVGLPRHLPGEKRARLEVTAASEFAAYDGYVGRRCALVHASGFSGLLASVINAVQDQCEGQVNPDFTAHLVKAVSGQFYAWFGPGL